MSNDVQLASELTSPALQGEILAPSNILSSERFELTDRYAVAISRATLLPKHLQGDSPEEAYSNCFLVVNQALTWGVDPLAVAQATSVVHGKLCYEGKLVQAVLNMNGIRLHTRYEGERGNDTYKIYLSDQSFNEDGSTEGRVVEGSVKDWATFGSSKGDNASRMNAAWKNDPYSMLHYRGHRQWARLHEPGLIMGVYTPDEMERESDEHRSRKAKDITKSHENNSLLSPEERKSGKQNSSNQSPAQAQSRPTSQEGGTSEDGGNAPHSSSSDTPISMSRGTFELYAQNLGKLRTEDNLNKGDKKFSAELKGKPNLTDVALFKSVYTANANRIAGKLNAKDCETHIAELIGEAFK
ncbi:recombinase RecT [Pseudovibrio ascidiaceicola]|uniref:recombinase RecT n=1 Tax=Pseudovibrio ascidiaceicola TaxID=285279 RepID=UPI003D35CADE